MSKRKLSRKQAWRAQKIQEERIKRAQKKNNNAESQLEAASDHDEHHGNVIACYGVNYLVVTHEKKHIQCMARQNLGTIIVGDKIIWQAIDENSGVITAVLPRKTLLERPNFHGNTKPVAANIDQIFIVNSPVPALQTPLIDRYLVAVELTGITPIIVVNKIDLLNSEKLQALQNKLEYYSTIGYELLYITSTSRKGMKALEDKLLEKTSILVGQSGVGKSSTIKTLLPDMEIQVGELSEISKLGKHTTSASRLYHLPYEGAIIDSPGVRDFGLWHLPKEKIAWGFIEFRPYLGSCKFSNCSHMNEPGCSIIDAKNNSTIPIERWNNYCGIYRALT